MPRLSHALANVRATNPTFGLWVGFRACTYQYAEDHLIDAEAGKANMLKVVASTLKKGSILAGVLTFCQQKG